MYGYRICPDPKSLEDALVTLYEKEISECLTNGISLKTSMQAADINGDGTVSEADKEIGIDFALTGSSTYSIGETVENTYPCVVAGNRILVSAQYAYNPSGLRSAKTVGGSTKYFVYNGMNIVYEYEDSISDGVVYCYGLNRTHNSDSEIYVYNAHGDTVQLVKDNAVVASYTYDAFGNLTSELCDNDNAFLYCSEYFDTETKTYYLRARYYNPANGRFTQQDAWAFMDAADPLSLNLYTYCFSNPVMYVDPSGNWPDWGKLISGAMLIGIGVLSVGAVLATGGAATFVVAAIYAGMAAAGTMLVAQGSYEVEEAFTGQNPLKNAVGEEAYEIAKYSSLAVVSFGTVLFQSGILYNWDNSRKTNNQPIYSANGNAELRAERRPIFDEMLKDFHVGKKTFRLNIHAYNSFFKSGRKDIMPADVLAALSNEPSPADPGSVAYVNPATGTTVFVNPETNEVVGVFPEGFLR